jgi:YggT family protein
VITYILAMILWLYMVVLIGRVVFDWIQFFARDWKPRGIVLVVAEAIYTVTDPPLRALRRVIPPVRIGSMRLDVAFLILFLAVSIGARVLMAL